MMPHHCDYLLDKAIINQTGKQGLFVFFWPVKSTVKTAISHKTRDLAELG